MVSTASVYFGGARRHDVHVAWLVYADVELFLPVSCVQATGLPPVRETCVPRISTREHALPPRVFKKNPIVTCSAYHSSYKYSTLSVRGPSATEHSSLQSKLLGQFRIIGDSASDVSGGRICLTQNAYAEIYSSYGNLRKPFGDYEPIRTS